MRPCRWMAAILSCSILLSMLTCPGAALDAGTTASTDVSTTDDQSNDRIHYIKIDTDQTSDCFLIESDGQYMLVDTSNPDLSTGGAQAIENDDATVNAAIRYLDSLGISSLDYVVLTHSHSDHIGGVSRLCEAGFIYSGTTVYYRSDAASMEDIWYPSWENGLYLRRGLDAITQAGATAVCLANENITDLTLTLGDFSIEFLNLDTDQDGVVDFDAENENNNSIVLKITKGSIDTLLAGDIEVEAEQVLAEQLGPVEVLKVAHHGNTTSSSYEFLKALQPETAILTSDGYWQYGAYEYLRYLGSWIYTTGGCDGDAIVEVVRDDSYDILHGIAYFTEVSEGWHAWLDHSYYIEHGQVFRDGWKLIDGDWYYFNQDGIMQTGQLSEHGTIYTFDENGALIQD